MTELPERYWYPRLARDVAKYPADSGIARRLNEAREQAGLSVEELAERAGTTPTAIQTITCGKGGECSVALLTDVARALEVSPAWLVFGDGEPD